MAYYTHIMAGMTARGLILDYLIVAGGNGGQSGVGNATDAGAGSGGNVLFGTRRFRPGTYSVVVGLGGNSGGTTQGAVGSPGTHSAITGILDTAFLNGDPLQAGVQNGLGGGFNLVGVQSYGWGGQRASAPGGFNGGAPGAGPSTEGIAGRAGGAGAGAGGSATGATPGAGIVSSISGAAVEYGRGGTTWTGVNGVTPGPGNPGQGGYGGRGGSNVSQGTNGQNGILILRYPFSVTPRLTAVNATATSLGGFTILTWGSSGTFTVL